MLCQHSLSYRQRYTESIVHAGMLRVTETVDVPLDDESDNYVHVTISQPVVTQPQRCEATWTIATITPSCSHGVDDVSPESAAITKLLKSRNDESDSKGESRHTNAGEISKRTAEVPGEGDLNRTKAKVTAVKAGDKTKEKVEAGRKSISERVSDAMSHDEDHGNLRRRRGRGSQQVNEGAKMERKHALVDPKEIQDILKTLGPIYRRRIFIEQLKSRWYLIVIPIILVVALAVTISAVIVPLLSQETVIEKFLPPSPIVGTLKLVSMKGINLKYRADMWESSETKQWAHEVLAPELSAFYQEAGFPLENVTIMAIDLDQVAPIKVLSLRLAAFNDEAVIITHVVFPSKNETLYRHAVLDINKIIRSVRKSLIAKEGWKIDPRHFTLQQRGTIVRASSTKSFLAAPMPPLDLFSENGPSESEAVWNNFLRPNTNCRSLYVPTGASVQPYHCQGYKKHKPNTICTFSCDVGLNLVGTKERVCFATGVWSGDEVDCVKSCQPLTQLLNGIIRPPSCTSSNGLQPDTRCLHVCHEDYSLVGSFQRLCQEDGTWSSSVPVCKRECPLLKPPVNGHMTPSSCATTRANEGDVCTFSCDELLVLQGESSTTCDSDGRWTEDVPVCRKKCNFLESVPNADVHPPVCAQSTLYEGMSCSYTCHNGFRLVGPSIRFCDSVGNWSMSQPTCSRTCSSLEHIEHGDISPISCAVSTSLALQRCTFTCDANYLIKGSQNLTCLHNGEWNNPAPFCVAQCPELIAPKNGGLSCSGNTEDSSCVLYCNRGNRLHGPGYLSCQADGTWSEPLGTCRVICPKITVPDHGSVSPAECSFVDRTVNDTCAFSCHISYGFSGSPTRTCLENGTWSGVPTTCDLERQYRLILVEGQVQVCLTAENRLAPSPSKRSLDECDDTQFSLWSLHQQNLLKNAGNGMCIGFTHTAPLAEAIFLSCNASDARQIWEWPTTTGDMYTIRLRDFELYLWYGYSTASGVLAAEEFSPLTRWLLYDIETMSKSTFYGASNNGKCPMLSNLVNGRWSPMSCGYGAVTSGKRCSFLCTPGYEIQLGESTVTCSNGLWEGHKAPLCVRSCVAFNAYHLRNGSVTPSYCTSNSYVARGSICTFQCDYGHELVGERNSACLANGHWSAPQPQCERRCPPVVIPVHGKATASDSCPDPLGLHNIGNLCILGCDDGYVIQGSTSIICLDSGSWNDTTYVCSRSCPAPVAPYLGTVLCDGPTGFYPSGTNCSFICLGMRSLWPSNANRTTCLPTGTWDIAVPACQHFCPSLSPLSNGSITPAECLGPDYLPNQQECTYLCDHNFTLSGSSSATCLSTGHWSKVPATCLADLHFIIVQSHPTGDLCVSVQYYPHHNSYHVIVLPHTECNHTNLMSKWSYTTSGQIRNVATGWCLGVFQLEDYAIVQLLDCDASDQKQRWECQIDKNVTILNIKSSNVVAHSGSSYVSIVEKTSELDLYSWTAIDAEGNRGSVCGMVPHNFGTCPKLVLASGASITPHICQTSVNIGVNCTVTCDEGFELESGGTRNELSCNEFGVWSSTDILCKQRSCKSLTLPANSTVNDPDCESTNLSAWSPTACAVTCNPGSHKKINFEASGNLYCLGNGVWSESVPECLQYCSALTVPLNGVVLPSDQCQTNQSSKHGDICEFSCLPHYKLVGSKYLECETGSWNSTVPICTELTGSNVCDPPAPPDYGHVMPQTCIYQDIPVNTSCSIFCVSGLVPVPVVDKEAICQANGEWTSPMPVCKRVCSNLTPPEYSTIEPPECTFGQITASQRCTVICHKSFALNGNRVTTCLSNGQWDLALPKCERKPQFLMQIGYKCAAASNGTNEIVLSKQCKFHDLHQRWEWVGLRKLRNVAKQSCMAPKSESLYSPIVLVPCDSVTSPWNCRYTGNINQELIYNNNLHLAYPISNAEHLFVVDPEQEEPRWLSNRATLASGINETDTGTVCSFRSQAICPPLPPIANGYVQAGCGGDGTSIAIGSECQYFCNNGYKLIGQARRYCKENGLWNDTSLTICKRLCPVLDLPQFSTVDSPTCISELSAEGSVCNFQCTNGFSLAGINTRICRFDGTWSGVGVICHKKCPFFLPYNFRTTIPESCGNRNQTVGSTCRSQCSNGYTLVGSLLRTCLYDGTWTGIDAQCLRSCPPLHPLANGRILPLDCIGVGKKVGDTCIFSCNNVYGITGPPIQTCTSDGLWSGTMPSCLKTCQDLLPPTNGYIKCVRDTHLAGDVCVYSCAPNYVVDGISNQRTCLNSGQWSGSQPTCAREHQFVLFQSTPPSSLLCLSARDDKTLAMNDEELCSFYNSSDRWTWYHERLLRHVDHRLCLHGNLLPTASHLILKECDDTDPNQRWECADTARVWYIRLSASKMYPLFSILSAGNILLFSDEGLDFLQKSNFGITTHTQWYAKTSLSKRMPVCSAKGVDTCPALLPPTSVNISPTVCTIQSVTIGTECYISCPSNFMLSRPITATVCLRSGHWSHDIPTCIPACTPFSIPITNTLQVTPLSCAGNHKHPESFACKFSCPPNSRLIGNSVLTCMRNSEWNFPMPQCKATCPSGNALLHGIIAPPMCSDSGTRVLEETKCTYTCLQTEHMLSGPKERVCTHTGKWSDAEPRCVKPCPAHVPPNGGSILPTSCATDVSLADRVCAFVCDPGLVQLGSAFRLCQINGTWSNAKPVCQNACQSLPMPNNGVIKPSRCTGDTTAPGHMCFLMCNPGFEKRGEETITCAEDGNWTTNLGECVRRCPKLIKPLNGQAVPPSCLGGDLYEGHECTFSCQPEFLLRGSDVRLCQEDGTWSGNETHCQTSCSPLGYRYNVVYQHQSCEYSLQVVGAVCTAYCSKGMTSRDGTYVSATKCTKHGKWDATTLQGCYPTCAQPYLENGDVSCVTPNGSSTSVYTLGTTCTTKCDVDHIPAGEPTTRCTIFPLHPSIAFWSPLPTQCVYEPDPMIIINRLKFSSVCFGVRASKVILVDWAQCSNQTLMTEWIWQDQFLIRNVANGLCMAVSQPEPDVYVTTAHCNATDPLQQWECSKIHTYGVMLRDFQSMVISTSIKEIDGVILSDGIQYESMLYTYNPHAMDEVGTLCSRRPYSTCPPPYSVIAYIPSECQTMASTPGSTCTVDCISGNVHQGEIVCDESGKWKPDINDVCHTICERPPDPVGAATFVEDICQDDAIPTSTVCTLTCPAGQILIGRDNHTLCTDDGYWKPMINYNCMVACPKITSIANGYLIPPECVTGICTLHCNPGYRVQGPSTRVCFSTGKWSEIDFICITEVQFLIASSTKYKHDSLCLEVTDSKSVYKKPCVVSKLSQRWRWNSHYTLETVYNDECLAVNSTAVDVSSGNIVPLINAHSSNTSNTPVDSPRFTYAEGRGSKIITKKCNFTDPLQRWTCGSEDDLDHLHLQLASEKIFLDSGPIFRSSLDIGTEEGYSSTKWLGKHYAGERNICAFRNTGVCPPLRNNPGGSVLPLVCKSEFVVRGTRCRFTCNGDYTLEGEDVTICTSSGKWSRLPPYCLGMGLCPALPRVAQHVDVTPLLCTQGPVAEGYECHVQCKGSSLLAGKQSILCGSDGRWSDELPRCNAICPALHPPRDGLVYPRRCEQGNIPVSFLCYTSCNFGFTAVGDTTRACLQDGSWSGAQVLCIRYCPPVEVIPNGIVIPSHCQSNHSAHGMICRIECGRNYALIGSAKLVCNNGNWSSEMPSCSYDWCERLASSSHSTEFIEYSGTVNGAITLNSMVTISCRPGYATKLPSNRICLVNRLWSAGNASCEQVACPFLSQLYHGSVTPSNCTNKSGVPVGGVCYFTCTEGYLLAGPTSKECQPGGTWSDIDNVECQDTHSRPYPLVFAMVLEDRQEDEEVSTSCIEATRDKKATTLATCNHGTPYQLWRWFGSSRIQNIANQLCLNMVKSQQTITLDVCSLNGTSQHIECGDISSVAGRLRVMLGGVFVGRSYGTTQLHRIRDLSWSATVVDYTPSRSMSIRGAVVDDSQSPICSCMCGGNFTTATGDFSSPSYPNAYPSNVACVWIIHTDLPRNELRVDFWFVSLEDAGDDKLAGDDGDCTMDYLTISEGVSTESNILKRFCTSTGSFREMSLHGVLRIEFFSDHNFRNNGRGFAAHWSSKEWQKPLLECGAPHSDQPVRLNPATKPSGAGWQAVIKYKQRHVCNAFLLSQYFLIASAHCVNNFYKSTDIQSRRRILIVRGFSSQANLIKRTQEEDFNGVRKIWLHPDFSEASLINDIAIVLSRHPFLYHTDEQPICLPDPSIGNVAVPESSTCWAVQWIRDMFTDVKSQWDFTRYSAVKLLPNHRCHSKLQRAKAGIGISDVICAQELDDLMLVNATFKPKAISPDNNDDSLLQCRWNSNWYVVGVHTFTLDDDDEKTFVFANVNYHYNWVKSITLNAFYYLRDEKSN